MTVPCTVRYDVSGERCGEPAVKAYRSFVGNFAFRCAIHVHPPGIRGKWWSELSVAEAVVRSVMEKVQGIGP